MKRFPVPSSVSRLPYRSQLALNSSLPGRMTCQEFRTDEGPYIVEMDDDPGNYVIGAIVNDEWLRYTVDVSEDGESETPRTHTGTHAHALNVGT